MAEVSSTPSGGSHSRLLRLGSFLMDLVSIVISFIDMVADVAVAVQFWNNGHMGWFSCVVASLVIANCFYTFWMIENPRARDVVAKLFPSLYSRELKGKGMKVLQYIALLPFAQFGPTLLWWKLGEGERRRLFEGGVETEKKKEGDTRNISTAEEDRRLLQEELHDIREAKKVLATINSEWEAHIRSHALFYVETIVEAVPQSIIQLLAATALGEATNIQLFSMSLSLLSMLSKGYVLCRASDASTALMKFSFASFDLFTLFYTFSTVLSKDRDTSWTLPFSGGVETSGITYLWFIKLIVFNMIPLLVFAVLLAAVNQKKGLGFYMVYATFVSFLYIPITFVCDAAKLSWFIPALDSLEPKGREDTAECLALRKFVEHGSTRQKQCDRLYHLYSYYYRLLKDDSIGAKLDSKWTKKSEKSAAQRAKILGGVLGFLLPEDSGRDEAVGSGESSPSPLSLESNERKEVFRREQRMKFNLLSVFWELNSQTPLQHAKDFIQSSDTKSAASSVRTRRENTLLVITATLNIIGAIPTVLYAPLNALFYYNTQNPFQLFCLTFIIISVMMMLVAAPGTKRFCLYSLALRELIHNMQILLELRVHDAVWVDTTTEGEVKKKDYYRATLSRERNPDRVLLWIALFLKPSNAEILSHHLPKTLLNHDLVERVTNFVPEEMVDPVTLQQSKRRRHDEIDNYSPPLSVPNPSLSIDDDNDGNLGKPILRSDGTYLPPPRDESKMVDDLLKKTKIDKTALSPPTTPSYEIYELPFLDRSSLTLDDYEMIRSLRKEE